MITGDLINISVPLLLGFFKKFHQYLGFESMKRIQAPQMLLIHWSKALSNKILQEQGVRGCCSVANKLLLFKVGLQTAIQSLSHVQLFATQHYGLQHARLSCSSLFPSSNRHAQIHVH